MNEKAKISISWLVTVVFVPLIAFSGLRMINGLDQVTEDVQAIKIQQAVDHEQLQQVRVYMRLSSKPNTDP